MENFFVIAAQHRGGYILRPDLLDLGLRDRDIRDALRAGLIVRLRAGTYAPQSFRTLSPEEQHRLLAFSVVDRLRAEVVLSHHSASIIHTGVSHDLDLGTVHVTRLDGRHGRQEAGVAHHVGAAVREDDVVMVDGRPVVTPVRAVLESASLSTIESGMVQTSFALRELGIEPDELMAGMRAMERWPGMAKVRLAVRWAAPACESVGEVRSVHMFRVGGLPLPRLQVELRDENGRLRGRVDFDWEEFWHCGEFDGVAKYGRLNPFSGAGVGQVLVDEKRREDRIREHPRGVSRWTWGDLDRPLVTCQHIRLAMERSRRLYGHDRTIIA